MLVIAGGAGEVRGRGVRKGCVVELIGEGCLGAVGQQRF